MSWLSRKVKGVGSAVRSVGRTVDITSTRSFGGAGRFIAPIGRQAVGNTLAVVASPFSARARSLALGALRTDLQVGAGFLTGGPAGAAAAGAGWYAGQVTSRAASTDRGAPTDRADAGGGDAAQLDQVADAAGGDAAERVPTDRAAMASMLGGKAWLVLAALAVTAVLFLVFGGRKRG